MDGRDRPAARKGVLEPLATDGSCADGAQLSPASVIEEPADRPQVLRLPRSTKSARWRATPMMILCYALIAILGLYVLQQRTQLKTLENELTRIQAERDGDLYMIDKLTGIVLTLKEKQTMTAKEDEGKDKEEEEEEDKPPWHGPQRSAQSHACEWSRGASYHSYHSWKGDKRSSCTRAPRPLPSSTALMSLGACSSEEQVAPAVAEEEESGIEVIDMDECITSAPVRGHR